MSLTHRRAGISRCSGHIAATGARISRFWTGLVIPLEDRKWDSTNTRYIHTCTLQTKWRGESHEPVRADHSIRLLSARWCCTLSRKTAAGTRVQNTILHILRWKRVNMHVSYIMFVWCCWLTAADPLWGPRVLTSLPSISKPSVGNVPKGRAGLSPTRWQST